MVPFRLPSRHVSKIPDHVFAGAPFQDLANNVEKIEDPSAPIDTDLVSSLMAHAVELDLSDSELDAWLAPRVHSAIRVSRRIAGDKGFWTWIAIRSCQPYLQKRFASDDGSVPKWRYTGPFQRNAVSRLWWGSEMARNGPDYSRVADTFRRVRTAQFALELKYSWYRPAVIAFVSVAEGLDGDSRLSDDDMSALSRHVNSYLSLTSLEGLAMQDSPADEVDETWWSSSTTLEELLNQERLRGPQDGYASGDAVAELVKWFRQLAVDISGTKKD